MLAARDELLDCYLHRALVVDQHERGARSVVADAEAGRLQTLGRRVAADLRGGEAHGTNDELYLLAADAAGTVNDWRLRGDVDDCRFHADLGRSGIEDGVDAAIEIALARGLAVVGLVPPKRLALGAAIGTPAASIKASATGCAGMRMPTFSRPAVHASGMMSRLGSSSVSGPGMKHAASFCAASGHALTRVLAISIEQACTMIGSQAGRCLASKMRSTASRSRALAPSP